MVKNYILYRYHPKKTKQKKNLNGRIKKQTEQIRTQVTQI